MRRALVGLVLLTCAAQTAAAQRFAWRPDDRVLLGALGELGAIAVSPWHVYGAGPTGVVVYDLLREAWAPPLPLTQGMPLSEQPTALAFDPLSDALVLGTANGTLYTYTLGFDRWDRVAGVTAGPVLFLAATGDGVYIAGRDGWQRLDRGGFIADRIPESAVPADIRARAADRIGGRGRDPWLDAARATLGLDPALRRWPITDMAAGERPGETWLATAGGGLIRYDSRRMRADWLPIGVPGRGVSAIAIDGQNVWLGGDARGRRNGVARTSASLDRWDVFLDDDGAPRGLVRELLPVGGTLWAAADGGLYRLDAAAAAGPGAPRRGVWRRVTAADGLPGDRVTSVAAADDGVWVATTAGLAFVDRAGDAAPFTIAPGSSFGRIVMVGDTLWAAAQNGLWVVPHARQPTIRPGGLVNVPEARPPAAFQAPGSADHPALRGGVLDAASDGARIAALTQLGVFVRDGGSWTGPHRVAEEAGLGRPARVRIDGTTLWVAGERGAAALDLATGTLDRYLVPGDVPAGPVVDVVPDGEHVWLATPLGALRLRLQR